MPGSDYGAGFPADLDRRINRTLTPAAPATPPVEHGAGGEAVIPLRRFFEAITRDRGNLAGAAWIESRQAETD
jgi:hypothetical protein